MPFQLMREERIAEINSLARLYRHDKTGAELLSLENDDENKVFGISFFTPPSDSTGLPHILEHSVLCGSQRFPLKKPFVELLKGSLASFLNAMTFYDKTCYPVASTNLQDFYNLIDVYIDAVLHPLITPETLAQEGWHYEVERADAPLVYKGVVFNEMKGAYSSPDGVLNDVMRQAVLPDTIYGFDAGGDPKSIPDLTYENFKRFHETYYHPSNALIFFYGNDDAAERLRLMDTYLNEFDAAPVDSTLPPQPRFAEPRTVTHSYHGGDDAKSMIALSWLLTQTTDYERAFHLQLLSEVLSGTPAAPLYKALTDARLGEQVIAGGVENHMLEMTFTVGLKGVAAADADRVQPLILDTLRALARDGIDRDAIEAALNTIEFMLRENNTGTFPRGLSLMLNALTTWLYGGDPLQPLAFEAPMAALKARIASGERVFEDLIHAYLLDNPHRAAVTLTPDREQNARDEAAERARLDSARSAMTDTDLDSAIALTHALQAAQTAPDAPSDLARMPRLAIADLERAGDRIPLAVESIGGARLLTHDLFTNGVAYLDIGFNLQAIPQTLLPLVPLYSRALLEMGTTREDFVRLSQRIGRKTGGISATRLASNSRRTGQAALYLFLRAKGVADQIDDLLAILHDVLTSVELDNRERFRQMANEDKASLEARLAPSGHLVVNMRLKARFTLADWAVEQMSGIEQLQSVRRLIERIENDWGGVLADLRALHQALITQRAMLCNLTIDGDNIAAITPRLAAFVQTLPLGEPLLARWTLNASDLPPANEGLTFPAQVNYVAKGADLYRLGYRLHGSQVVITRLLGTTWLWDRIRVQGGAYGGFASFDRQSGAFTYLSYRDPNLLESIANYDQTGAFLRDLDLPQEELDRAIIGAIQQEDTYLLPDARGYTSMVRYLAGETDETRQAIREGILTTTLNDFKAFADVLDHVARLGSVVVLGSADKIAAANAARDGFLTVTKVM